MNEINKYDWARRIVQKQNQNLRGTNQSSGLGSVGSRGIDKGIVAGGLTGGGIGKNAINTDQAGNIQTSTHLNLQHSVLPLVSDATILVTTFNSPNFTADIKIYGLAGVLAPVSVYRPDGSVILCHPAGAGTGWDLGHDFVTSNSVYLMVYFDVFFDGAGNGRFVAVWKTTPFSATELTAAFRDGRIPFLATPGNTNTNLTAGTSGTYTNNVFAPSGSSGGAGTAGITSIAGEAGPSITIASSDSSVIITPVGNNIDLKTTNHGTVTSVTASSPLSSSGGATPNITITSPLPVANGGTGTTTPSLIGGTNIAISGSWPNQTVTDTGPTGTVTSVGLALPGEFTVSGTPVTTTGTLTGAWASQIQNKVFAAPSGSTGTPTFRLLVASDIPVLDFSKITTGTVPVAQGGTNITSYAVGDILYASASGVLSKLADIATGNALISGGVATAPSWGKIALDGGTPAVSGILPLANGGTNADLSGTGGTSFVLRQSTTGAAITVSQLSFANISGSVSASQLPNPTASTLGGIESLAAVTSKWINTISTSGVPSATQPASTDLSDSSTGTWIPVVAGQTTAGTQTYSTQAGTYVVLGDVVFISCTIVLTAFDPATAGNINIIGLPFMVTNTNPTFVFAQSPFCANVVFSANYTQFIAACNANTSRINLYELGSAQVQHRFQPANMTNTTNLVVSGFYRK